MEEFKKLLLIEFVIFSIILVIGIVTGLLYKKFSGSTQGYFTSSIIGIAGSYLGYSFVFYFLYSTNLLWHAMPIRLIGATLGAVVILWACRLTAASA
jgi:uncharacterized membrane protein YeaQ/YmgE (transglycosylase-associated protein family)